MKEKIFKYEIARSDEGDKPAFEKECRELTEYVNDSLKEGWKPLGGVAIANKAWKPIFFQAMVKTRR